MSAFIYQDIACAIICFVLLNFLAVKGRYPAIFYYALSAHCVLPFFLNYVLFDPSYMSDQFLYLEQVKSIRDLDFSIKTSSPVYFSSLVLSMVPMPFYNSVVSLSFANTFIFILLFHYIYSKNIFSYSSILFICLYPSLALYSSVALRDTIIFSLMTLSMTFCLEKRYFFSLFFVILLALVKIQNAMIVVIFQVTYWILRINRYSWTTKIAGMGIIYVSLLILFGYSALSEINLFRQAMYIEDGGLGNVSQLTGPFSLLTEGTLSSIYFLIKPLPWEASGPLQLIQSAENIAIIFMIFMVLRDKKISAEAKITMITFLGIFCFMYGLIVFNFGTSARYRFPSIALFFLFAGSTLFKSNSKHIIFGISRATNPQEVRSG